MEKPRPTAPGPMSDSVYFCFGTTRIEYARRCPAGSTEESCAPTILASWTVATLVVVPSRNVTSYSVLADLRFPQQPMISPPSLSVLRPTPRASERRSLP